MVPTDPRTRPEPAAGDGTRAQPDADRDELPDIDLPRVEERVHETGAFSVLQWLLDTGVLPYQRYEQWRYGEWPDLGAALDVDPSGLQAHLEAVGRHARALGLMNTPRTFYHWDPEHAEHALTLSRNTALAEQLAQYWARARQTAQLDLFMDGGASVAERELQHALAAHNPDAAEGARARLCALAPNHPALGDYESLVLYIRHIAAEPDIADAEVADELAGLDEEIVPIAHAVLGEHGHDYLVAAWRRLARALPREWFDPDRPRLHASYPWVRIPEPDAVRDSVLAVADHSAHAPLLIRLAAVLDHQRRSADALLVWACSHERDPDATRDAIEQSGPARLRHWLRAFDDLEVALAPADFPAWLLLQAPGLAVHGEDDTLPLPTGATFATVRALLRARAGGTDEIPARERLKAQEPILLRLYLQGR